jgi:uncharacterized Zn ribbon protein
MIDIKRKWPPETNALPARHVLLSDEQNEILMIAQYGKSFIGRAGDAVLIVDDVKSHVKAAVAKVANGKINYVRIVDHEGSLDSAFCAVFKAVYGQSES